MTWSDDATPIGLIRRRIAEFARERAWEPYHSPKNLASAIVVEAAELLELYLWGDEIDEQKRPRLEEEAADVAICLLNLCNAVGLDLAAAIERKIALNEHKYPAARVRGSAKKYDDY